MDGGADRHPSADGLVVRGLRFSGLRFSKMGSASFAHQGFPYVDDFRTSLQSMCCVWHTCADVGLGADRRNCISDILDRARMIYNALTKNEVCATE